MSRTNSGKRKTTAGIALAIGFIGALVWLYIHFALEHNAAIYRQRYTLHVLMPLAYAIKEGLKETNDLESLREVALASIPEGTIANFAMCEQPKVCYDAENIYVLAPFKARDGRNPQGYLYVYSLTSRQREIYELYEP